MKRAMIALAAALALSSSARAETGFADSWRMSRQNAKAGTAYHRGRYEESRAGYMRAKDLVDEHSPENTDLHFNIGATFYKEGNYAEAEKEFQIAAGAADPVLREEALYNLGNVVFQQGIKAQDVEKLKKAAEYYQQALQLNPDDEDAKYNLEVVRRHINMKRNEQQQQQGGACPNPKPGQQQQNQQGQQGQQDQKPGQQQQQQQQPGQQQQQQGQQQQDQQQQPGQQPQPGQQQQKPGQQDGGTTSRQPQPAPGGTATEQPHRAQPGQIEPRGSTKPTGKLTKEEAARILQAVQQQEEEDLKEVMKATRAQGQDKEKDW